MYKGSSLWGFAAKTAVGLVPSRSRVADEAAYHTNRFTGRVGAGRGLHDDRLATSLARCSVWASGAELETHLGWLLVSVVQLLTEGHVLKPPPRPTTVLKI
jgi:hypothetical protein